MLTDMCVFRLPLILTVLAVTVWMVTLPANGSPCTDNSHNCQADSQRCVERNNSSGFTCQCVQPDQQLDDQNNCTDIPDSQRLYLATPINITTADLFRVNEILKNPLYSEMALRQIYRNLTIPSYKGVKFIEYRLGPIADISNAVYSLLFTEDINAEILETVAWSVLLLEKVGKISAYDVTVPIAGYTGIFLKEEDMPRDVDAVDWCSFPSLYSCRENSTCRDSGLRYDCPCNAGFVDDGHSCYECHDDFHYGPNCAQPCACVINNTRSCDHVNGTCFCKEPWEGVTCDTDTDECTKDPGICGDPFTRCVNTDGGYECVCSDTAVHDAASGDCIGAIIRGPSPFDTDGSRDLNLHCMTSNETEVTQYTWSDVCLQEAGSRCTIRPQPPWDDGKNITCTVMYRNGQSVAATFEIDLNYPPSSSPVIEGYVTGQAMRAGETLEMTCSVHGGKPLVTSVTFSCPRHPDRTPDVIRDSGVTSVLEIKLTSSDDGALCGCSAMWKTRSWYPQSSTRILVVKGTVEADAKGAVDTLDIKLYAIFGVLGLLAVIMVIVVVVICRRRASGPRDGTSSPSTDMSSAGTTVTSKGTGPAGTKPPEPHRIGLSPLDRGRNAGKLDVNPLPEPRPANPWPAPRPHVWSLRPEPHLGSRYPDWIDRDSTSAESGTYHTIPDPSHQTVTEDGHILDLYLHPVLPSRVTAADSCPDLHGRPGDAHHDGNFIARGSRQDAYFRPRTGPHNTEHYLW